jgi:hypothetical protein
VAAANARANTISVLLNAGISVAGIAPAPATQPLLSARTHPTPAQAMIRIHDTMGRLVRAVAMTVALALSSARAARFLSAMRIGMIAPRWERT